jgi:hypothetical protein
MENLEDLIQQLSVAKRDEVRDFVLFLLEKQRRRAPRTLCQDWAGGLADLKNQFTAIELQKKALDWRGD